MFTESAGASAKTIDDVIFEFSCRWTFGQTFRPTLGDEMHKRRTHIDLGLGGDSLQVDQITHLLGVSPTSGFNPRERYVGKVKVGDAIVTRESVRPPFGIWHFSTELKLDSNSIEDHARLLLDSLRPAKARIEELLQSSAYKVWMSIWYFGPVGFDISSEAMSQLSTICQVMHFKFFEVEEIEEIPDTQISE